MKTEKKNKLSSAKRKGIVVLLSASAMALIVGALALFTSRTSSDMQAQAGSVVIELDKMNLTNSTNVNPGDNDPSNGTDEYSDGTDHEFSFVISNLGTKSARTRTTILITADKAGESKDALDAGVFQLYDKETGEELYKEKLIDEESGTILEERTYILSNDEEVGTLKEAVEAQKADNKIYVKAVKYTAIGNVFDGKGPALALNGNAEKEDPTKIVASNAHTSLVQEDAYGNVEESYLYDFVMLRQATNKYQGCDIQLTVIVEAMQYRNTNDEDWSLVTKVEKTYSTSTQLTTVPATNENSVGDELYAYEDIYDKVLTGNLIGNQDDENKDEPNKDEVDKEEPNKEEPDKEEPQEIVKDSIFNLPVDSDLEMKLTFDAEEPTVTFTSPDNTSFVLTDKNFAEVLRQADGTITYKIEDLKKGPWGIKIAYGKNTDVRYSIMASSANANNTTEKPETNQTRFIEIPYDADLEIGFTFDKEVTNVTFVSPDGKTYSEKAGNVKKVLGSNGLSCKYFIEDAKKGTWTVDMELGKNTDIKFSTTATKVDDTDSTTTEGSTSTEGTIETIVTRIFELPKASDVEIGFTFDKEVVDISFISPSGKTYTSANTDIIAVTTKELNSTYKITAAEAGKWNIKFNAGENRDVNYSIIATESK